MASLYKRKTVTQRKIMRMIEGAVMDAAFCHPEYGIDRKIARSIAKRATGTLTAEWPVLAQIKDSSASDAA